MPAHLLGVAGRGAALHALMVRAAALTGRALRGDDAAGGGRLDAASDEGDGDEQGEGQDRGDGGFHGDETSGRARGGKEDSG